MVTGIRAKWLSVWLIHTSVLALASCAPKQPPTLLSETAVGQARLQQHDYEAAATHFQRALQVNPHDQDALSGLVDASLARHDDHAAFEALERLLAEAPQSPDARARLEMVRVRVVQDALTTAVRALRDGSLDLADAHLAKADQASPGNPAVLRTLALAAMARGRIDVAEARVREALGHDPQDPQSWSVLGEVLMLANRSREAVPAFAKALALAPDADTRQKLIEAQKRAELQTLPEPYNAMATASAVTRSQVAALLGTRLAAVLASAPTRSTEVLTDLRNHWASRWILSVVRAGWVEALPNHTFQPNSPMTRAELARILAAVLTDAAAGRPRDLAQWRAVRLAVSDVAATHSAYSAIGIVSAAGIMTSESGRFRPSASVSGVELLAAVNRLETLVK